jgi:predicted metal-dependent hydrolase
MRAIWNIISSTARSEPVFTGAGRVRPLTVMRRAGARGLRLAVDPRDGAVRLTLGPRAPLRPALAWAEAKRDWIERELAKLPVAVPIKPDMVFDLGDDRIRLDWSVAHPRQALLDVSGPTGVLRVGGPQAQLSARVLRFLRSHAQHVLGDETRALAAIHGLTVGKVGVGDPRSRWGSCSASGDIRYSWRLILAPAYVRQATVAHEVAHRVHLDHSPAFHRLAAQFNGNDPSPARAWLRSHGPALHWFGRTS